jgi:hypothetical protein
MDLKDSECHVTDVIFNRSHKLASVNLTLESWYTNITIKIYYTGEYYEMREKYTLFEAMIKYNDTLACCYDRKIPYYGKMTHCREDIKLILILFPLLILITLTVFSFVCVGIFHGS